MLHKEKAPSMASLLRASAHFHSTKFCRRFSSYPNFLPKICFVSFADVMMQYGGDAEDTHTRPHWNTKDSASP
jgi:hypothetical protein